MAQTITSNLKNSLARPTPVYKKTIELYRRVWGGAAYAYDSAVDITGYLTDTSPGTIRWKLDKEDYGVFNLDNVTLIFRNDRNQWKQDNPKGLFPSGNLINQSKIVIKIGGQLADGTFETLKSFTGYISGDPEYNPEEKTVSMTLVSAMSIFEKYNAENISTLVSDELLLEDSGTEGTTANNGVGVIVAVKRGTTLGGAVEIKPTTDYTLSDLNKPDSPLKITLVSALTAGEKLYCSYRYWYQDKMLEWLVEQVMTVCGVSTYSILPAVFVSDIETTWDFNSQADWEACTLTNIDTKSHTGYFGRKWFLLDDFSGTNTWDNKKMDSGHSYEISAGVMRGTVSPASSGIGTIFKSRVGNEVTGSWDFKAWITGTSILRLWFIAGDEYLGQPREGFYIRVHYDGTVNLYRGDTVVSNPNDSESVLLITAPFAMTATDTIRVTRTSAGLFTLYINGVSKGSATDANYNYTRGTYLENYANSAGTTYQYIDDIRFSHDATTDAYETDNPAILESTVKSGITSLSSLGTLTAIYEAYGQTVLIETNTSSDSGATWEGWTAISATGDILSAIYATTDLKFRVSLTTSALNNVFTTPLVDQITVKYYTSAITIDLVNLTNMNCKEVLDLAAEMPAYEIGFKSDDTFVYHPRSTTTPSILDFRSSTNIKSVRNLSDGIDRVYNRVNANFGIYRNTSDASGDSEPNSITKYGTREYSVSASNLLPAENVNIAIAIAPTILAYTKTPRRRCTIESKFILHLELGDKVTVYYDEPTALRQWRWGDMDVSWGQADLEYYNAATLTSRLNLWGVVMRVEGIEFDFQEWKTSFDLVEVI